MMYHVSAGSVVWPRLLRVPNVPSLARTADSTAVFATRVHPVFLRLQ